MIFFWFDTQSLIYDLRHWTLIVSLNTTGCQKHSYPVLFKNFGLLNDKWRHFWSASGIVFHHCHHKSNNKQRHPLPFSIYLWGSLTAIHRSSLFLSFNTFQNLFTGFYQIAPSWRIFQVKAWDQLLSSGVRIVLVWQRYPQQSTLKASKRLESVLNC